MIQKLSSIDTWYKTAPGLLQFAADRPSAPAERNCLQAKSCAASPARKQETGVSSLTTHQRANVPRFALMELQGWLGLAGHPSTGSFTFQKLVRRLDGEVAAKKLVIKMILRTSRTEQSGSFRPLTRRAQMVREQCQFLRHSMPLTLTAPVGALMPGRVLTHAMGEAVTPCHVFAYSGSWARHARALLTPDSGDPKILQHLQLIQDGTRASAVWFCSTVRTREKLHCWPSTQARKWCLQSCSILPPTSPQTCLAPH